MDTTLKGKLLIAMPQLIEPIFSDSVIFMCEHSSRGAMGIIVNKPMRDVSFMELTERLNLSQTPPDVAQRLLQTPVLMGGPVEQQRGFVLHSRDYEAKEGSLSVNGDFALTATLDILQDMALGRGPDRSIVALGYAGWVAGQLENEIKHNGWLHCDADKDIVFSGDFSKKYHQALSKIGIDPRMLSGDVGHA